MHDFINGWHVAREEKVGPVAAPVATHPAAIPTSAPNVLIPLRCRDEISGPLGTSKTTDAEINIAIYTAAAAQWLE